MHYEAVTHLDSIIHEIKNTGALAGVALNPATPVSVLKEVVGLLDIVLIMSVNPGFGGQKYIPYACGKVRECSHLILQSGSGALLEVDGGVSLANAGELIQAGANVLVAGNAVFGSPDPKQTIHNLKEIG